MSNKKIEIERRFLIKENIKNDISDLFKQSYDIKQYYLYDGTRLRQQTDISNKSKIQFIKTIKTKASDVSNFEDECFISKEEFFNLMDRFSSCLMKTRDIFTIKGFKYELDTFTSPRLKFKILEIEFENLEEYANSINDEDFLEKAFQDNLICEITGLTEFNNYNLSLSKG